MAASVTPSPEPPYASGMIAPSQPARANALTKSQGYSCLRSFSSQLSSENEAAIVLWSIWAALVYAIGTRLLPEQDTHADWGEVARTVGFAQAPGLLRVFGIVPVLGHFVRAATDVWVLIATVVAVRQALDYRSLPRALGVCLVGWVLQVVVFLVLRRTLG